MKKKKEHEEKEKKEYKSKAHELEKKVKELESQMGELQEGNQNESTQKDELKQQVKKYKEQRNEYKQQTEELTTKVNEYQQEIEAKQKIIEELEKEKEEMKTLSINIQNEQNDSEKKEQKKLQEKLEKMEKKYKEMKKEKEEYENKANELEQQVEETKQKEQELIKKNEEEIDLKQSRIVELEKLTNELMKSTAIVDSSASSEDNIDEENVIIKEYESSEMKYNERGISLFGESLEQYVENKDEEVKELEIIRNFGEGDIEHALYLLNSIIVVSHEEITKKVERDGSLRNQILDIQYLYFIKTIQITTQKISGFIEGIIKDNQCFEKRRAAEFEQMTAHYFVNYIKHLYEQLGKNNVNKNTQHQIIVQTLHFVGNYILDILLKNEQYITCGKGLQLKFFFNNIEMEMSDIKILDPYRKDIQNAVEISSLFVLDYSNKNVSYEDMKLMFPHLSGCVMYALLSKFKPDTVNNQPVDQSVLSQIDKHDGKIPAIYELIDM